MRIIIENTENWILHVRSARQAIEDKIPVGQIIGYLYEDGTSCAVRVNKNSVRVYP